MRPDESIAILGAGLSGLSLACALLETGERRRIIVLDRRREWGRDRTWCTWATESLRFAEVADHAWPAWRICAGEHGATVRSPATPYLHIGSEALYGAALDRLERAANVELVTPAVVRALVRGPAGPVVQTDRGEITAAIVFDALGPASPLQPAAPAPAVDLLQSFLGWEVRTERPVFDPGVATLMDFRADPRPGVRFLYVLPFATDRALVEDTSVGREAVPAAERRQRLTEELAALGAGDVAVLHEEQGRVAMSLRSHTVHLGPDVHAVGAAAGAVRPSSGYAFSRIQRHCSAVAAAVAAGRPLPERIGTERTAMLDTIFLHALDAEPERFPRIFAELAASVAPDRFARFMTDRSTALDEAKVIAALPKGPFLRGAMRAGIAPAAALRPRSAALVGQ